MSDIGEDDSIDCRAMSKAGRGSRSSQQRIKQFQKLIFISKETLRKAISPIKNKFHGNGGDSRYAAEGD